MQPALTFVPGLADIFPFEIDVYKEAYVTLTDSDGNSYAVSRRAVLQSPVLKLRNHCAPLPLECPASVAQVVIEYLYYKLRWGAHVAKSTVEKAPFFAKVPAEHALQIAEVAQRLAL